eukprot:7306648-Pyramimonas_sp.AAC.1
MCSLPRPGLKSDCMLLGTSLIVMGSVVDVERPLSPRCVGAGSVRAIEISLAALLNMPTPWLPGPLRKTTS